MAQRGSTAKPTRFKGPLVVTLRGAGSLGNDPMTKGAGTDVGLDIQVPTGQTANVLQITKPDGTVIYALGPSGSSSLIVAVTASGAIPVRPSGTYLVTKAGVAVLTLAAPTVGTDDGIVLSIESTTAFAHTLTATGLLQTGSASINVATFAAFAGAGLRLRAYQGKWIVESQIGITFS